MRLIIRKSKTVFGEKLLGRNDFKHEVRLFIEADDYPAKIDSEFRIQLNRSSRGDPEVRVAAPNTCAGHSDQGGDHDRTAA